MADRLETALPTSSSTNGASTSAEEAKFSTPRAAERPGDADPPQGSPAKLSPTAPEFKPAGKLSPAAPEFKPRLRETQFSPEAPEFKPKFVPNAAAAEFVPKATQLSSDAKPFIPSSKADGSSANGGDSTESSKKLSSDAKPFIPSSAKADAANGGEPAETVSGTKLSSEAKPFIPSTATTDATNGGEFDGALESAESKDAEQAPDFEAGVGAESEYVEYPAPALVSDIEHDCAVAFKEIMKAAFENVPGIMMLVKHNGPYNILFRMRFPHAGHLRAAARKVAAKHTYTIGDRPIFVLEAEIIAEPDPLDAARGIMKQTVELSVYYLAEVGTDVCWALVKNGQCIRGDLCPWVHIPNIGIRVVLEADGANMDGPNGGLDGSNVPIRRGKKGLGLGKGSEKGGAKGKGVDFHASTAALRKDVHVVQAPAPNDNPGRYLMDSLRASKEFPAVSEANGAEKKKEGRSGRRGRGQTR